MSKLDQPQDRGAFFKALGTLVGGFLAERVEDAVVGLSPALLRPPGALDELAFLTACTRCDKCLRACPESAIRRAPSQAGLSAGTPYVDPLSIPCVLCSDLPCIPACPEGALVWPKRETEEGPAAVRMGTASIQAAACLTYAHAEREAEDCRVCVDRCPFPEVAITMTLPVEGSLAHPQVDPARCTGCGLCAFACPAPVPAIVVEPRR